MDEKTFKSLYQGEFTAEKPKLFFVQDAREAHLIASKNGWSRRDWKYYPDAESLMAVRKETLQHHACVHGSIDLATLKSRGFA